MNSNKTKKSGKKITSKDEVQPMDSTPIQNGGDYGNGSFIRHKFDYNMNLQQNQVEEIVIKPDSDAFMLNNNEDEVPDTNTGTGYSSLEPFGEDGHAKAKNKCFNDAVLLEAAIKFPWLYDATHPRYRNGAATKEAFYAIAQECDRSYYSIRTKFTKIRAARKRGEAKAVQLWNSHFAKSKSTTRNEANLMAGNGRTNGEKSKKKVVDPLPGKNHPKQLVSGAVHDDILVDNTRINDQSDWDALKIEIQSLKESMSNWCHLTGILLAQISKFNSELERD